jgi:hypothetical protein
MRTRFGWCAIALVFVAVVSAFFVRAAQNPNADPERERSKDKAGLAEEVLASVRQRLRELGAPKATQEENLVRVTAAPFHVKRPGAQLCRSFNAPPSSPHDGHWIDVYVTQPGRGPILSGKGVYPEGTMILKKKLIDAAGTRTDLYTGMLKREKGYNPQSGDWEFFVLNGKASSIEAAGKLRSCIECHEAYSDTDFVSRSYLTEKVAVTR